MRHLVCVNFGRSSVCTLAVRVCVPRINTLLCKSSALQPYPDTYRMLWLLRHACLRACLRQPACLRDALQLCSLAAPRTCGPALTPPVLRSIRPTRTACHLSPSARGSTLPVLPRPLVLRRIATSQTLNYQGRRPAFATTWLPRALPRSHRTLSQLPLPAPAPACPCTSSPAQTCLGRYPALPGLAGLVLGLADCTASVTPNYQPPEPAPQAKPARTHPPCFILRGCVCICTVSCSAHMRRGHSHALSRDHGNPFPHR